ncbi:MAG: L-threonylcarbamoyladenylate synthase [Acidobacteriota bacterium]
MLWLNINSENPDQDDLKKIADLLSRGGVACIPTETFYALAAYPFLQEAVDRIFSMKGREHEKPLILLLHDRNQVFELVSEIPASFHPLATSFWPGALTMLLKSSEGIPRWIDAGTGKVGLRVTSNRIAVELIKKCGFPLTGTSANKSGKRPALTSAQVLNYFGKEIDCIVNGGNLSGGRPSTLIDITVEPPVLLREGRISREEIESVLNRRIAG